MIENTISLYYIEGIDFVDTPYFANKEAQDTYFKSKLLKTVESSYYPPYYTNKIRFSTDDLTLDTNCNYLSLYTNNRVYYYFIDTITYINENLYELNIVMDTIQTYMFNINVVNGCIERKFIDRWNSDGTINRNYIRENVSNGMFYENSYKAYDVECTYIMHFSEYPSNNLVIDNGDLGLYTTVDNTLLTSTLSFTSEHILTGITFQGTTYINNNGTSYNSNFSSVIQIASHDIRCQEILIFPFNPLYRGSLTNSVYKDGSTLVSTGSSNFVIEHYGVDGLDIQTNLFCYQSYFGYPLYEEIEIPINFSKNTSMTNHLSINYCPVLLDENYLHLEYGEINNPTSFPLYRITDNKYLYGCRYGDIISGARYYWILANNQLSTSSPTINMDLENNTMISCNIPIKMNTFKNPENDWLSYNRGALFSAMSSDIYSGAQYLSQAYYPFNKITSQIDDIMSNPSSYDRRYKASSRPLKKKERELVSKLNASLETVGGNGDILPTSTANYFMTRYNLHKAPMSIKSNGNTSDSIFSARRYYRWSIVNDINTVLNYYHLNGYLVNEIITSYDLEGTLFDYVHTRYYYNILKMSTCNVHLNCLESNDIIDDIKERLINGLRLWNTDTQLGIGEYQLDNVELSYL